VPPIDIARLLKTLDQTGLIFRISFTGGEPFLVPNLVEACEAIAQKHFLSFNTNLTSPRIPEFANRISPDRVVLLHASLHIQELQARSLTERYIRNYRICQEAGFPMMAVQVGYPPLLRDVESYRKFFGQRGVPIRFYTFEGEYEGRSYPDAYSKEEADVFGFDHSVVGRFHTHGFLCNAGYNVGIVSLDGGIHPCFKLIHSDLGHIYSRIEFFKHLTPCPFDFCGCPMHEYDPMLYQVARSKAENQAALGNHAR
jgi:MoaA/NifB/PqqE/SkfB family radical SAM enzyme